MNAAENNGELLSANAVEKKSDSPSANRHNPLRVVASFYEWMAYLIVFAACGSILLGAAVFSNSVELGIMLIVGGLLGGAIGVVTCTAFAQGIRVFLEIEENTRNTCQAIRKSLENARS